jgi:hypothetical protein
MALVSVSVSTLGKSNVGAVKFLDMYELPRRFIRDIARYDEMN